MFNPENLKQAIKTAKTTQKEVAKRLNISQKAISTYTTGQSKPDYVTTFALAKVLDIEINNLNSEYTDITPIKSSNNQNIFNIDITGYNTKDLADLMTFCDYIKDRKRNK